MEPNRPASGVVNAFLREYLADLDRGAVRTLSEYQALFPGHADLIQEQHARLTGSAPSSASGSASGASSGSAVFEGPAAFEDPADRPVSQSTLVPGLSEVTEQGEYLGGRYRLIREIARGGQGAVFLAEDESLGRTVAVKVLTLLAGGGEEIVARFRREARVASRLDHPGICAVYDAAEVNDVPYVVMRYVDGETLAKWIARIRNDEGAVRADPWSGVRLVEKVARALDVAHEAGVVHRDIKPGNIMVTPDGDAVILDFGLARDLGDDGAQLTQTGDVFGTPAYMAPEQVAGRGLLDRRTDVHALGAILFELATGRRPYVAATRDALYHEILTAPVPDCRRLKRSIGRDQKVVIETALSKESDGRYMTAKALADDLRALRESRPISAVPPSRWTRVTRWARREPWVASLTAALVVASAITAGSIGYQVARAPLVQAGEEKVRRERIEELLIVGFSRSQSGENLAALREVLAMEPSHALARAGIAWAHLAESEPTLALDYLDTIDDPTTAERRLRQRALEALDRGLEARTLADLPDPESEVDLVLTGLTTLELANAGEDALYPKARDLLRRAIVMSDRAHPLYHVSFTRAAHSMGDAEGALAGALAMERMWPHLTSPSFFSGLVLSGADPERAWKAFTRVLELADDDDLRHPYVVAARVGLGQIAIQTGDPDGAVEALQPVVDVDPDHYGAHVLLGYAQSAANRPADAVDPLRRAVELRPEQNKNRVRLATALSESGRHGDAAEVAREAIDREPSNEKAHQLLVASLLTLGDQSGAIAECSRRLEVAPDDTRAQAELDRLAEPE